jgi:hypothetical protein
MATPEDAVELVREVSRAVMQRAVSHLPEDSPNVLVVRIDDFILYGPEEREAERPFAVADRFQRRICGLGRTDAKQKPQDKEEKDISAVGSRGDRRTVDRNDFGSRIIRPRLCAGLHGILLQRITPLGVLLLFEGRSGRWRRSRDARLLA